MSNTLYIQKYCHLKDHSVFVDGEKVFSVDKEFNTKEFFKSVYQNIGEKYSKFFKMDSLSKLTFLSAEFLLNNIEVEDNTAIVLSNRASSLDTDRKHQEAISDHENYFPSPAVFVYTLPNIGIGEISIKHQLKSENAFFVFDNYNAKFHYNYEKILIQTNKSDSVLAGWVDIDQDSYEAFLYLISKNGILEHTEQNLNKLYNK